MGEIANGFLLSVGCTIPVEFDTDSAACIMPHSLFKKYFNDALISPMSTMIYDIQEVIIPVLGIVMVQVEGILSKSLSEIPIPLNIMVPFLLTHGNGDRLLLSAKWMGKSNLNILRFMDELYEDSLQKVDNGLWNVRLIGPSTLTNDEWALCTRYHNTIDGHTGSQRLQRLIRKNGNDLSLTKCEEFIRYCADCQKANMAWLVADHRVNIDNN